MEKNGHIKLQSIANILLINIQHIDKPLVFGMEKWESSYSFIIMEDTLINHFMRM